MYNYIDSIAEKLRTLFVGYDKNYIEQLPSGKYVTHNGDSQFLGIEYIKEHLKGTRTFGVLESISTRFMTFDIDDNNKTLVKAILWLLRKYDFPDNAIHVNLSGKKGYHVHVFFALPVSLNQCLTIQHCILYDLYELHPELSDMKVEIRPLPGKGIKLPIGVHQVTMNRCWFCNKETLEPINDFDYLFNIHPAPREIFCLVYQNLIYRNSKDKIIQRALDLKNHQRSEITAHHTNASLYEIISSTVIESIGTRHNTLLDLCVKLFFAGVPYDECLHMTKTWMNHQDKSNYSTPEHECIEDIDRTVKSVYEKFAFAHHKSPNMTILLKHSELDFVLKLCPSNTQKPTLPFIKVLLYFIIEHRESGILTANWMPHAMSCIAHKTKVKSVDTIRKHIYTLVELGYLKIRKGKCTSQNFFNNLYGNPANEYRITQKLIDELAEFEAADTCDKTFMVQRSNSIDTVLRDAANALFTRKELREMLTKAQYANLCLMKEVA